MHFFNLEKVNNRFQGPVYDSKPREPGFFTRAFPSLSYYLRVYFGTTLWTVIKAKRGTFDDKAWLYSCNWFLDEVERTGIHVHADGLQYIDQLEGRPCVICANHMSTLETYMLPAILLPRFPVTFVVKKYLVEMPLFCDVMKSRSPVVLGRSNPREDLLKVLHEGSDRLKKACPWSSSPREPAASTSTTQNSTAWPSSWRPGPACRSCRSPSRPTHGAWDTGLRISGESTRTATCSSAFSRPSP